MKNIKCPTCGTTIELDEKDYLDIVSQVRTEEFKEDLKEREEIIRKDFEKEKKLLIEKYNNEKMNSINEYKEKIAKFDSEKEMIKLEINEKNNKVLNDLKDKINSLEKENISLKSDTLLKIKNETDRYKESIQELKNNLDLEKAKFENQILAEKSKYDNMVKEKDELIDHYKDLKIKLSTKAIGEELEVYCKNIFDSQLRPVLSTTGNNIYFEKDNEVIDGTKGDFVYRETTKDGAEIISIMFEMKNEADDTESKHKNSDFFKKLDSDRKKKNCEYAVLVTLLEADNEQYNNGITNVYEYENMYVIRPNSFSALINLLRNSAIKNTSIKNELVIEKTRNIDVTNFENKLIDFQSSFSKNFESFEKHFGDTIEKIDKTIKNLEAIRTEMVTTGNQLRLANNKAQDLTIKKLTFNNPTMKKMFDDLKENDEKGDAQSEN